MSLLLMMAGVRGFGAPPARPESGVSKEYQIKAVFLFNFVQFVRWPDAAFPESATPISIGILGDGPFASYLEQGVRGETVRGRPLVVRRSQELEELKTCHVLFVSRSERGNVAEILAALEGHSILTVGETEGFAAQGGIINFFLHENKVRFEINPDAARNRGLEIGSQLLNLAKIVAAAENRGGE